METLQRQEEQRDQSKLVNDLRNKFVNFPIGRMLLRLIKDAPAESRPQLTIQLFGMLGHGKSELVNSCLCVARDEPYKIKCGAVDSTGAFTRTREVHNLTRNIRICDNRGLKSVTPGELYEMEQQLKGKRGDLTKDVNFETSFFARLFGLNTVKEKPGNVYVPVIVYKCDSHQTEDLVQELVPLIKIIRNVSGQKPIIVLTYSEGNNTASFKQAFNDCSCHDILTVENYTERNPKRTHDQDAAILTFLLHCLEFVQNEVAKQKRM